MIEWTKIFNQVSQLKIKSITDPLFKFGTMGLIIAVISALILDKDKDWVVITIFIFSGLFIFIGLIFYIFFAIKKPDYLRSETYQIQKQAVELLGDNERANNKNLTNIHLITNPYSQKLDKNIENPLQNE